MEHNDQGNNRLMDTQQDGVQVFGMESKEGKEKDDKQVKSTKRRRPITVTPNLDTAIKKVIKKDSETGNKFDVLKDLKDMD